MLHFGENNISIAASTLAKEKSQAIILIRLNSMNQLGSNVDFNFDSRIHINSLHQYENTELGVHFKKSCIQYNKL